MSMVVVAMASWVFLAVGAAILLALVLHGSGGPRASRVRRADPGASWVDARTAPPAPREPATAQAEPALARESVQAGRPW